MDIDVQNAQSNARRALLERDAHGRLKCLFRNNYGHIKRYCRKWAATRQMQQVQLANAAFLAELPGNDSEGH